MRLDGPEDLARLERALRLFVNDEEPGRKRKWVEDIQEQGSVEYAGWVRAARTALVGGRLDPQTLVRARQVFLLSLGHLMETPNRGYADLITSEMNPDRPPQRASEDHPLAFVPQSAEDLPPLRRVRAASFRTSVTRALRTVFKNAGEPLPTPYEKLYYDDTGRKFVRNALAGLTGKGDAASGAIATAVMRHWPSIVGSPQDPVCDEIACAVIWHHAEGRSVLCVSPHGAPAFLFVPSSEAASNATALRACAEELRAVRSGAEPRLSPGRYAWAGRLLDPATQVVYPPFPHGHPERFSGPLHKRPEFTTPIQEAAVAEIRSELLAIGKAGRGVFDERGLTSSYVRVLSALSERITEAAYVVSHAIDPEARALLTAVGLFDLDTAAWFTGHPNLAPHPEAARIRRDAEDAFCATGPLFYTAGEKRFRDAVTTRQPILPLVREMTGLTKAQVQVVSAMKTPSKPDEIVREFPPFDPEIMRGADLKDLAFASRVYALLSRANPDQKPAKLAAEAGRTFDPEERRRLRDAKDLIASIETRLITPMSVEIHGEEVAETQAFLRSVFYPKTLARLADATRLYHAERMWSSLDDRGGYQIHARWSPLTAPVEANGFVVRELTSTEEIRVQGRKQSHCVGDYAPKVLDGRVILLSADRNGEPHSTVEVLFRRDTMLTVLDNVQHRAAYNRDPVDDAKDAVAEFLRRNAPVQSRRFQDYIFALEEARANAIRVRTGSPEHAFGILSPILPQKTADAGYAAVLDAAVRRYERRCAEMPEPEQAPASIEPA